MNNEQLFIAPKLKIGFQNRTDTYTGRLAYVIYYDLHGVLRKEKSWQTWRSKEIEPLEFENTPTEGFVLNKKVGGGRSDWNVRQEYVRVYDPRNFEFEITVPNLLFILAQCDCSRGKGLEGKFVYAWSGTTLVLLPASSEEYKKSAGFTDLQIKTIPAKDLVKGAVYLTKQQEKLVYLDRRIKYSNNTTSYRSEAHAVQMYVFFNEAKKDFVFMKDMKKLAAVVTDTPVPDYAELIHSYDKSIHGSPPVRLFLKDKVENPNAQPSYYHRTTWYQEDSAGKFLEYIADCGYGAVREISNIYSGVEVSLIDNKLKLCKGTKTLSFVEANKTIYRAYSDYAHYGHRPAKNPVPPPPIGNQYLHVELASGSCFTIDRYSITAD